MKSFNTVVNILLIIAVGFLFWKSYGSGPTAGTNPKNEKEVSEKLEGQDFSGVRIAYINTDSLVEKYDYHKELRAKLEKRAKALEEDLARKSRVFQENVSMLQQQADRMSEKELQAAQMDLQQSQERLMSYRDQKAQELATEEQDLNRLIMEDMDVILDSLKVEFGIDFILSYDPSSILLEANEDYNITEVVAERLNKRHKREKAAKEDSLKEE